MRKLRAGLLGLGMMGKHHLRVLSNLPGVELVAVADANSSPHGVVTGMEVLQNLDDLLKVDLDYCVVAIPTEYHLEAGRHLAEAGIHALIEKPLAQNSHQSRELVQAFDSRGLIGAVGHIERFNPALRNLRTRLEAGELGDIYQVATRRQGPFPARIADVGVVKDLASHDIDLTRWITDAAYRQVSANTLNRSGRSHEDMVSVTGLLENSIITNHLVNWLTPSKERRTIVTGERGMFVADTLTADLTFYSNATVGSGWNSVSHFRGVAEGDVTKFAITKSEPLYEEHCAMRDALLGREGSNIVTLKEGADVVRVCEAIIESAVAGRTITF